MTLFDRKKKSVKARAGFTLVEVLVAIAIFALTSVLVGGVFLNANKLQRHTANLQALQNEGRYLMEKLAREIRGRQLQLPSPFAANPLTTLSFRADENGNYLLVCLADGEMKYFLTNDKNAGEVDCLAGGSVLNAPTVAVTAAKFFVLPKTEYTWGGLPVSDTQPRVTIFLQLKNAAAMAADAVDELTLQTTISSKIYER